MWWASESNSASQSFPGRSPTYSVHPFVCIRYLPLFWLTPVVQSVISSISLAIASA